MSLTPISRDAMLSLKALKDEEIRQKAEAGRQRRILDIVTKIYNEAKTLAETTTQTTYSYKIPEQHNLLNDLRHAAHFERHLSGGQQEIMLGVRGIRPPHSNTQTHDEFHVTNMVDILTSLRDLFPGCTVNYSVRSFARGHDGQEHDVSTFDAAVLPLLSRQRREEVIVVDWS
jgi:hypothetical protein